MESCDEPDNLKIFFCPACGRIHSSNHPVGLFMVSLILAEPAHFVKQRRGLKEQALLDPRIASDQSAVRESIIELQRKSRDSAHAGIVGCDEVRPFSESRQTR